MFPTWRYRAKEKGLFEVRQKKSKVCFSMTPGNKQEWGEPVSLYFIIKWSTSCEKELLLVLQVPNQQICPKHKAHMIALFCLLNSSASMIQTKYRTLYCTHASVIWQWLSGTQFMAVALCCRFCSAKQPFCWALNTNWWGQRACVCSSHARQDQTRQGMFTGKIRAKVRHLDQISYSRS